MVEAGRLIRHGCGEQTLGQDHPCTHSSSVREVAALANKAESIAGSNHPGIGCRAAQILAEVFEDRWIVRGNGGEVVEGFVRPRYQACSRNIMTQDPSIDYLGEERALGNELVQEMRDVFLSIGHESFFIASSSSKGNDDCLLPCPHGHGTQRGEG